ncbi:hypothetical protein GC174_08735 [bacterium]|nr:hypothetical protein [bacterium]
MVGLYYYQTPPLFTPEIREERTQAVETQTAQTSPALSFQIPSTAVSPGEPPIPTSISIPVPIPFEAPPPEPVAPYMRARGIDVSEHQATIDWNKVSESGIEFAFIRASEGLGRDWEDDYFQQNWKEAKRVGITRGAYHFFRPNHDIQTQIETFSKAVGKLEPGDLPPVLDLEDPSIWAGIPLTERIARIEQWMNGVEATLGVRPMIYASPGFIDAYLGNSPALAKYPLWVAHWKPAGGSAEPSVPAPYQNWLVWQHSSEGSIPGIKGHVDLNFFNGDRKTIIASALPAPIIVEEPLLAGLTVDLAEPAPSSLDFALNFDTAF